MGHPDKRLPGIGNRIFRNGWRGGGICCRNRRLRRLGDGGNHAEQHGGKNEEARVHGVRNQR